MSHLRQVGATGATRGRGREAGAQEGGTGRRLFLFLGVENFDVAGVSFFCQKSSPGGVIGVQFRSMRYPRPVELIVSIRSK
jgi:hypothetical protein